MEIGNDVIGLQIKETTGSISLWSLSGDGTRLWQARDIPPLALRHPETKQITAVEGLWSREGQALVFRSVGERAVDVKVGVEGNHLRISVTELPVSGTTLPEKMRLCRAAPTLQILPGLFSLAPRETHAGFVLPLMEGVWIPASGLSEYAVLHHHYVMGLSMGFWGACRPGRGSVVGISDHAYLQLLLEGGENGLCLTPELLRDPQAIPLDLEVAFIDGEQPLDSAKAFRRYELQHKSLPALSRRARKTPALNNLIGGANIKFVNYVHREGSAGESDVAPRPESFEQVYRFEDVARVCADLKAGGIDRAMAIFWGWGKEGYDRLHPDFLPANEWAGGDGALRTASDSIRQLGYTVGGHDNFQDIYQAAPSFGQGETVAVTPEGSLCKGGFWTGGRCYIQCSAEQVRFARRNLPDVRQRYGWNALFVDTVTAAFLYECYSEVHPRSREDDRRDKWTLMEEARSLFGVFGSEAGQSWGAECMDYWEGILLQAPEKRSWWWSDKLHGRPLPVFGAVYRDILLAYQHQSQGLHSDLPGFFLASLRSGQPPYYFFDKDYYPQQASYFRKTYEVLAYLHRFTADETIETHSWLTPDQQVEKVVLTGGTVIITNASDKPYVLTVTGLESGSGESQVRLAPWGFFVQGPQIFAFWAESLGRCTFASPLWAVVRRAEDGKVKVFTDRPTTPAEAKALCQYEPK